MADVVITAEGLSKKYLVYRRDARYVALRDVLGRKAAYPFRLAARGIRSLTPPNSQRAIQDTTEPIKRARTAFWALDDVSFTVERSNVVGIIGRNGAGKSTLLKILSRITPPTRGRVRIRGRMASLLEVGTGFHPELTGRENIMLNGAILGMSRKEITKHFDAIVEFAGVEAFIDTPVKRYSSGMYVRLAFAVAAHLDPEILVVDEVLAVGDAEFQKKCLGKMSEVSQEGGRTVIFVSHNMAAVNQLCKNAIWLQGGRVIAQGKTIDITTQYLSHNSSDQPIVRLNTDVSKKLFFTEIGISNHEGQPSTNLD